MAGIASGHSAGTGKRTLASSSRRAAWLIALAATTLVLLFLQLARLSVAEYSEHIKNVERFMVDSRWLPASRGTMRDRDGAILAQDQTSWAVSLQYDAIDGSWARAKARRAALEAVGRDGWRELSPDARDAEIDRHEEAFAQVLDDQTHISQAAYFSIRMSKPEALDVILAHQSLRLRDQLGRCGRMIQFLRCGSHSGKTLAHHAGEGKSMMIAILVRLSRRHCG